MRNCYWEKNKVDPHDDLEFSKVHNKVKRGRVKIVYNLSHHLVKKKKYGDMYTYVHWSIDSLEGSLRWVTELASRGGEQEDYEITRVPHIHFL